MSMTVKLSGFAELEKKLDQLTKAAGKGVLRRALKKAAMPIADAANDFAPVGATGGYAQSFSYSTKLTKRQRGLHRKMFRDDKAAVEGSSARQIPPVSSKNSAILITGRNRPCARHGMAAASNCSRISGASSGPNSRNQRLELRAKRQSRKGQIVKLLNPCAWRVTFYSRGLCVSVFRNGDFRHWHRVGPRARPGAA